MATTTALTTTYAGKFAGEYIRGAMYAIKSLEGLTVKENIAYKEVVKKLVDTVTFAAPTCDRDATGTVTITERILTLEWFEVVRNLCKKDFYADWEVDQMGAGLDTLPSALVDAVMENMLAGIAQQEEFNIWEGVNATAGQHDGLITLMLADATVIDVSSADAITSSTIVADLKRTLDASVASTKGVALHGSAELPQFYLGTKAYIFWQQAQAALGNNNLYEQGGKINDTYLGVYKINHCPGMAANTIVMAQPSNLWFGTTLTNQMNQVGVYDLESIGQQNVKFVANFAFAVQYGFGDEITLYRYPENS